jgi:F-type H+-transporting ATPase subunit delta
VRDTTVARSYAEALFELGERHGAHDDLAQGLNTMTALLASDARVNGFLDTPKLSVDRKRDALRHALGGRVSPMFLNFVLVVLKKRRQRMIPGIAAAYRKLLDDKLGRLHVDVQLAHAADAAGEEQIISELTRIFGRTVIPSFSVDPALMGGIVVRAGDLVLDGSLRHRLISLRHQLHEAMLAIARSRRA